jgi:hypothetical protein
LTLYRDRHFDLPRGWRRPFEQLFGHSFDHVELAAGPATDAYLASRSAVALTINRKTICLASQLRHEPFSVLAPLLGHELAHTVQLERGGKDSVDYLEAEAWQASRAALFGQRFSIVGSGSAPLAAAGLYMTDASKDFMEMFGINPLKVPTGNTAKIDPLTFETILDLMTDKFKTEDDFIIDAHGHPNGFGIPIAKGEQAEATTQALATLPKILDLRSALTKAGNNLQELQNIVRDKLQSIPASPGDPKNQSSVDAAIAENKQKIEAEISRLKSFAKVQDEAVIARLIKKMADLKNKQRNRIELRTCNMGHHQGIMDFFRVLFNAKILRAATNFSAFGHFSPAAPRSEASYKAFLKQQGQVFPDDVDGGTFAFAYIPKPNAKAEIPSAATSDKAVLSWIKRHIGDGPNVKAAKFPGHFLLTNPPAFPLDTEYTTHIKESKAP